MDTDKIRHSCHPERYSGGTYTTDDCFLPSRSANKRAQTCRPLTSTFGVTSCLGYLCLSVFICGFLSGCKGSTQEAQPAGYFGPTESMVDVAQAINANNSQIPTLWAKGEFEATINDNGRKQFVNGSATLLVKKPGEFRMVGKKDVAGQIFELGTTADEYWMIVRPEADTLWWGTFDRLAQADDKLIPIQPDLLAEVLAVGNLDSDLTREPAPVMRFNNDADAYMFVWIVRQTGRWVAQKEIWYDRQTKHPKLVLLFDADGRIVLRAYLSNHKPIADGTAVVATRYDLLFPDRQSKLKLTLEEVKLQNNGVPREGSIRFPGPNAENAGVSNVVRVDENKPAR